ncbi:hypothetical protein AB0D42_07750 [Streptomyces sp. NPDC048304]
MRRVRRYSYTEVLRRFVARTDTVVARGEETVRAEPDRGLAVFFGRRA